PCVDRGGTVTIYGSGFGAQGDRFVELGGHGIGILLHVTSWSDTQITVVVPDDPRIHFSQWYFIGLQDHDRHWISNTSRTINICRKPG
ncbi:MAG: IPT/TIG domain-containing protein, partial [Pyrinomonadaceae bacterium]